MLTIPQNEAENLQRLICSSEYDSVNLGLELLRLTYKANSFETRVYVVETAVKQVYNQMLELFRLYCDNNISEVPRKEHYNLMQYNLMDKLKYRFGALKSISNKTFLDSLTRFTTYLEGHLKTNYRHEKEAHPDLSNLQHIASYYEKIIVRQV